MSMDGDGQAEISNWKTILNTQESIHICRKVQIYIVGAMKNVLI